MSPIRAQATYDSHSISFVLRPAETDDAIRMSCSNYASMLDSHADAIPAQLRDRLRFLFDQHAIDRCELCLDASVRLRLPTTSVHAAGRLRHFVIAYGKASGREIACDWSETPERNDHSGSFKRSALQEVALDIFDALGGQRPAQVLVRIA